MKKVLAIFVSIFVVGILALYIGITNEFIVIGNEYGQGVKYNEKLQERVLVKLKKLNISYIINKDGFITSSKRDNKKIKEIADQLMGTGSDHEVFLPLKPNTYFYSEGANEYFIELLKSVKIPYYIEYDANDKIGKISWDSENNRLALEQALKVNEKIGQTKTPPSIQMLSPEMNDKFENILKEKAIHYTRKGKFTVYKWKDWVEVEILKKQFLKTELSKKATN
jgi:hypothetical protein